MDFVNLESKIEDMAIIDATGNSEAEYFKTHQPKFINNNKFLHNKMVLVSSIKFKENPNEYERIELMKNQSNLVEGFTLPIWSTRDGYKSHYEYQILIYNKDERIILKKIFEEHQQL